MLELLAVPHRGIPYVQMGFRIVLYISNLFSNDSFESAICHRQKPVELKLHVHFELFRTRYTSCQSHIS